MRPKESSNETNKTRTYQDSRNRHLNIIKY